MMKKVLILFVVLSSFSVYAKRGTLILAHGSMGSDHHRCGKNPTDWEKAVINSVESIRASVNEEVELAFGMWNTMCFNMGIKKLRKRVEAKGGSLSEINVLPLFISSHSIVIEMQKWMFGLKKFKPIPFLKDVKKVNFDGKVNYMDAIDYHQSIASILVDRAKSLIDKAHVNGFNEDDVEVVLVMHGPVFPRANQKWLAMGNLYLNDLSRSLNFSKGHVVSLQDDAPKYIRNKRTKELRKIVSSATKKNKRALILPLLLSKGGIEKGILERLNGLEYTWMGEMILPDERLKSFFLDRLN